MGCSPFPREKGEHPIIFPILLAGGGAPTQGGSWFSFWAMKGPALLQEVMKNIIDNHLSYRLYYRLNRYIHA